MEENKESRQNREINPVKQNWCNTEKQISIFGNIWSNPTCPLKKIYGILKIQISKKITV